MTSIDPKTRALNDPRSQTVANLADTPAERGSPIDPKKLEEALAQTPRSSFNFPGYHTVDVSTQHWAIIESAARAYLATLPRTREVEVWHVEYVNDDDSPTIAVIADKVIAEGRALRFTEQRRFRHVRVTGPHKHVIPA